LLRRALRYRAGMTINVAFAAAAALALLTWGLHTFAGGPEVARPLLASALPPVPKLTTYYCWHLVTIVLFAQAGAFAYAAVTPTGRDVAAFATALAFAFALWSVLLVAWKHRRPLELPQWLLFGAIGAVAAFGFG
jgi:hypothetical protein